MPCNCDHMEPTRHERESVKVMGFLHELGLGDKPKVYGQPTKIHEHTAQLCQACKRIDITTKSLELQIWWRDHQAADRKREEREARAR